MYNKIIRKRKLIHGRKNVHSKNNIRVGILDDHLITIAGFRAQLGNVAGVKVVWDAQYFNLVGFYLKKHETDLLILDASVPTSEENSKVYPIFHTIPELLENFPEISIIVISMHNRKAFIRNVLRVGASGYIVKDDSKALSKLGEIIKIVGNGGVYFSPIAHQALTAPIEEKNNLTARQVEVLSYWAVNLDKSAKEVANHFKIANSTLRNHLSEIYLRLEVNRLAGAVDKAKDLGIITPEVFYGN